MIPRRYLGLARHKRLANAWSDSCNIRCDDDSVTVDAQGYLFSRDGMMNAVDMPKVL